MSISIKNLLLPIAMMLSISAHATNTNMPCPTHDLMAAATLKDVTDYINYKGEWRGVGLILDANGKQWSVNVSVKQVYSQIEARSAAMKALSNATSGTPLPETYLKDHNACLYQSGSVNVSLGTLTPANYTHFF